MRTAFAFFIMPASSIHHISLFGNHHQEGHFDRLQMLFDVLVQRGFILDVEKGFASYLRANGIDFRGAAEVSALPVATDAIISIGGDGTFLHAAQWARASEVPILGINTGHLGFLASYTLDEAARLADMLAGGHARVEYRSLLRLECDCLPPGFWPYALNEVAILKEETASMINVATEIDGYPLADYLADGLVISTPTGSTAYNLSAGGPIMQPTLECFTLSPVAPHTLTLRPLVISGESSLLLHVTSRARDFRVSLDGRSFVVPCGSVLAIRKALFSTAVIRRPDDDFASILRNKLLWGRR